MQTELLNKIRTEIRGADTRNTYSAWRHGDLDVEIIMHHEERGEQHLGYVTGFSEAVELIRTAEARDGTDDSNRDNHCDP